MKKIQDYVSKCKNIDANITDFRIGIPADFTFLIDYINGNENVKKQKACTGGKTKILVKADGLVQVCPAWKELDHLSAGNIYRESIPSIWSGGKHNCNTYSKFRDFTWKDLTEPCSSCPFVNSCIGGCTAQRILYNSNSIEDMKYGPDPLCFYDLIQHNLMETKEEII
jgi:radical SAM protein with 4Fe4S-binding SPASM domain